MAEQQEQQGFATPPEQAVPAPVVQSTLSSTPTKLSATDINTKISTGTPLATNEALPDVPQGMSAKGFYGQFPGGASVYSQAPFKQATYTPEVASQESNEADYNFKATTPLVAGGTTTSTFVSQGDQGSDTGDEGSSTSFDTQMNSLMPSTNTSIDLGYSFEFDPNLSIIDDISKNFDEFGVSLLRDTGIDFTSFEDTLKNVGGRLGTAAKTTLEEFEKETNAVLEDLKEYQLSDIVPDAINYVVDSFNELKTNLTNLANPDKAAEAAGYFATQFTKTIASNVIGKVIGGAVGGPIGMAVISLASEVDWEKGQIGRHFDDSSSDEPNTIAGYNPNGVAVNSEGNPGMIDGMYSFSSIGSWFSNFGKTVSEIQDEALYDSLPTVTSEIGLPTLIGGAEDDTLSDSDYSGSNEDSADVGGTGDIGSGVSAPSGLGSNPDDDGDSGSGSDSGGDGASDDGGAGDSYGDD
tara:strand:- start:323 stop:1720 length:1398 start_codon:yes stop_codon:yes gene_type:complete